MTYGIITGPLRSADPHKEPKTISFEDEKELLEWARSEVELLSYQFPEARDIDLLNAFLLVFIERTRP